MKRPNFRSLFRFSVFLLGILSILATWWFHPAVAQINRNADQVLSASFDSTNSAVKVSFTTIDPCLAPNVTKSNQAISVAAAGAAQLVALASAANRYVEETAPYKLAKEPQRAAELDSVLANLARTVGRLAVLAQPFLPATSQTIWGTLGPSPSERLASIRLPELGTLDLTGRHILKPPILFPKPRAAQA